MSRRAFTVRLKHQYRAQARRANLRIDGRTVARFRGGRAPISLRGRGAGTTIVNIVMRLRDGKRVLDVRRYRLCAPR